MTFVFDSLKMNAILFNCFQNTLCKQIRPVLLSQQHISLLTYHHPFDKISVGIGKETIKLNLALRLYKKNSCSTKLSMKF